MSERILFLDDDETRHEKFAEAHIGVDVTHVRTVEECKQALLTQPNFDFVTLDHDLGGRTYVEEIEGTGTEVALFIRDELPEEKLPDRVAVHSFNPAGAQRMLDILKDRVRVMRFPFFRYLSP